VRIRFCASVPNDRSVPAGKLADVELHFAGGELDGLRLIGFAVWARRDGGGKNVTFPARQFTVHGERRHFSLLRSIEGTEAEKKLKEVCSAPTRRTRQGVARAQPPRRRGSGCLRAPGLVPESQ